MPIGNVSGTKVVNSIKIPRYPMMKDGPYRYSFSNANEAPPTKGIKAKSTAVRYTQDVASNSYLFLDSSGAHCSR